jgi:hypothetical protein
MRDHLPAIHPGWRRRGRAAVRDERLRPPEAWPRCGTREIPGSDLLGPCGAGLRAVARARSCALEAVMRKVSADGHRFDSDLVCRAAGCSRTWSEHQVSPKRCGGEPPIPYPKPAKRRTQNPFSVLDQEHDVYQGEIERVGGYAAHAVSLVMGGEAGPSEATRKVVESPARERPRAKGVESGEDAVQFSSASIPD